MNYVPLNINNVVGRQKKMLNTSGFKFPTTKEVEQIVADVSQSFTEDNMLVDRYFPQDTTFSTSIEMYMVRTSNADEGEGMTFAHQVGANIMPIDTRGATFDLAKASWSPLAFAEDRTWDEKEMLYLGQLTEDVQQSVIDEEIANVVPRIFRRMTNRRQWMVWEIMRKGKITIAPDDAYNPSGLSYNIEYYLTDMHLPLPVKFDAKDSDGKSRVDPVEYFNLLKRANEFTPWKIPVKLIVQSSFEEILTDNTFIQFYADYESGMTALQMRPPRAVYRAKALDIFRRYTGLAVEFYDGKYKNDLTGQLEYWLPHGEMVVICGNDGPIGTFLYTPYVAGADDRGNVQYGTGPHIVMDNQTDGFKRGTPAFWRIAGRFHGLPRVEGYNSRDFSHHRIKWLQYADPSNAATWMPSYPSPVIIGQQPAGSPTV